MKYIHVYPFKWKSIIHSFFQSFLCLSLLAAVSRLFRLKRQIANTGLPTLLWAASPRLYAQSFTKSDLRDNKWHFV